MCSLPILYFYRKLILSNMETPKDNLPGSIYDTVYEQSEDSYLLIDALESEIELIRKSKPLICLEIGSGSGVVITALAMALKSLNCQFIAVDINEDACKATKQMSIDNNVTIDVLNMDLTTAFVYRGIFDLILFNPPYVVTDPSEVTSNKMIYKTWAGGISGREVIERLYELIPGLLSQNGTFYLLVLKENNPNSIIENFKKFKLFGTIILERRIRGEHLYVLKFNKSLQNS